MSSIAENFLETAYKQFTYYKSLGDKTFDQLNDNDIHWQANDDSNSISIIVKHIVGNMLSRWTNFLTEDGEKEWRHRDTEFEATYKTKTEMITAWEKGWKCLFTTLHSLQPEDALRIVYIRNQGHTVLEAITRQLCHYPYHIGQLVFVAKQIRSDKWKSLSIPKGKSVTYNTEKFNKDKDRRHFTEDL